MSCSGCAILWTSLAEAHCSVCHCQFLSVEDFDLHRIGGDCYDVEELVEEDGKWARPHIHEDRKKKSEKMATARAARSNKE